MASYIALLRKAPASDYGVEFPDLPGCITVGRTLDEARAMAAEALALHIEGMIEDRAPIPAPAALEAIMADPHNRDAVAILVDAPAPVIRSVRVNVTLPEDILKAIDTAAPNRSAFLAEAARAKLRDLARQA